MKGTIGSATAPNDVTGTGAIDNAGDIGQIA